MTTTVTLHPERAGLLAEALDTSAADLAERSRRIAALVSAHGEDLRPAVELARVATTLSEEAIRIRRVIAQVLAWEAEGSLGGRAVVLSGGVGPSHRHPVEAHDAAREVAGAYRRDGSVALSGVDPNWIDDPVFAGTLLDLLGAEAVVQELHLLGAAWDYPAESIERRDPTAVAAFLAALLATTTRAGTPAIAADRWATAADDQAVSLGVVGFLFLECQAWSPAYLAAMVDAVVVPVSRQLVEQGAVPEPPWFGGSTSPVDGRVLILEAVAAQPLAALTVAAGSDLVVLGDARAGMLDRGASMGRILVAATRPQTGADIDELAPVMVQVVETIVHADAEGGVAPALQAHLGELAAPWIGGFGATDFSPFGVPHPLRGLDPLVGRRFLVLAMSDPESGAAIDAAAWGWARASLTAIGLATEPLQVKHVADVLRSVAEAARSDRLADLVDQDVSAARVRQHVDLAMNVMTLPMKATLAGEATSVVVVAGTSHLIDSSLPAIDNELRYLRDLPALIADDQWAVQYLVVAVLWSQRDTNGLFAPVVGPPAPGQAARPTGRAFLDASGGLRPYSGLGAGARDEFAAWLYELDREGANVAHLANAAGAEYGASGG